MALSRVLGLISGAGAVLGTAGCAAPWEMALTPVVLAKVDGRVLLEARYSGRRHEVLQIYGSQARLMIEPCDDLSPRFSRMSREESVGPKANGYTPVIAEFSCKTRYQYFEDHSFKEGPPVNWETACLRLHVVEMLGPRLRATSPAGALDEVARYCAG